MFLRALIVAAYLALPVGCYAADFTGTWSLDLRSASQREQGVECGVATFSLNQTGNLIVGDHTFATPGCGRLNEGGEGTVKGTVTGNSATLIVTSGRNGAVVRGRATLDGRLLHWITLEELKAGEPPGDSPLILGKGTLTLEGAPQPSTLCTRDETVMFSCSAGHLVVSVCMLTSNEHDSLHMEYRAGRLNRAPELVVPQDASTAPKYFRYGNESRSVKGTIDGRIANLQFENRGTKYTIFGFKHPFEKDYAGIQVSAPQERTKRLSCRTASIVENFDNLQRFNLPPLTGGVVE